MTEATLGFKIDSSQAVSGAADLDRLTAAANRTQQAADKLEAEAATLGGALSRAGQGAGSAAQPLERVGKALADQDEHVRAFRMEVERLTLKYQPLAQATRSYQATIAEIERAHKVGAINAQQMTQALDRERLAYEKLRTSAASAGAAVKAANSNGNASRNFNTSNLAAQGFDIGSTAAFMPWYTVALQQGPQVSQVFNDIKASGQAIGPAVAGAFMQILNPISLVTIGVIGGVAALVQYFTTAEEGTGKTSQLFEEQNDIIRRAASLWGDAAPALKAYVDELDRAEKLSQGRQAGEILAGRELEGLSDKLDAIKRQATEAFRALNGDPNNAVIIRDLREAWGDLRERLDNGTASMADVNKVQQQLAAAVEQYGVKAVLNFRDAFDQNTESIYRNIEAAQKARLEWIKAISGGTNVQDIVAGATFSDGGRTFRTADFMPANIPVPGRRPLDLDQAPNTSWPQVTNGDGRLTNVPVPGQRPNFFEIEEQTEKVDDLEKAYRRAQDAKADFWLDIGFQERQRERSAIDQQVASTLQRYGQNEDLNSPEANAIRGQIQWQQAKDLAKGFGDAFSSELISGSHDIGKAFLKGFEAAISNEASKLWEKVFDSLGNIFANIVTGSKGGSVGGTGAGIASSVVSAVTGGAANDNMGRAPVIPVTRAPMGDIASYISNAAIARGIDPNIALRVAKSEGGLTSWNTQSTYFKNGVQEPSFGPFQLYKGGGLGNDFMAKTGLDPALAANGPAGVDFALDHASKNGWGAWYGAGKAGIGDFEGIGTASKSATDAVNKMAGSAGTAADGLNKLGGGLSQAGQSLAAGASGGGGGLLSGLSSIGQSIFASSAQFANAWKLGGIGLYADGTNYAPGGMAIVGERGPELVNLPQGSQVFNTNKSRDMMGANSNNPRDQQPKYDIHIYGGSGDQHIRDLVQQGVTAAQAEQNNQMRRGGFGDMQRRYSNQKG